MERFINAYGTSDAWIFTADGIFLPRQGITLHAVESENTSIVRFHGNENEYSYVVEFPVPKFDDCVGVPLYIADIGTKIDMQDLVGWHVDSMILF